MLANCRSQFLLDRLGRCLKLFVSTESTFASQFGLDFFIREKHQKTIMNTKSLVQLLFEWRSDRPLSRQRRNGGVNVVVFDHHRPLNSDNLDGGGCVCACVHECVCDVFAIYNNNIWPRLIMIIIQIIILYFIQITHTDDFPSTGTQLVLLNVVSLWFECSILVSYGFPPKRLDRGVSFIHFVFRFLEMFTFAKPLNEVTGGSYNLQWHVT